MKHIKLCLKCVENAYIKYQSCDKAMHFMPANISCVGKKYFFDYHNNAFFGIEKNDFNSIEKRQ